MINRIQNKSFCLHNIQQYVCVLYIYYLYINTHTYNIFENIYMDLHVYIYIIYIIYKYI